MLQTERCYYCRAPFLYGINIPTVMYAFAAVVVVIIVVLLLRLFGALKSAVKKKKERPRNNIINWNRIA